MRYVVTSLAVLLIAVSVGGQESPFAGEPFKGEALGAATLAPIPDDSFGSPAAATVAEPSAAVPDPFGDVPAPDPADEPLTEGQAVALRHGITRAREAAEALGQAAEAFKKGGDGEAAARAFDAGRTAREVSTAVAGGLERREAKIGAGIAKVAEEMARLQAELKRLQEELRRTQEGKTGPTPAPVERPQKD